MLWCVCAFVCEHACVGCVCLCKCVWPCGMVYIYKVDMTIPGGVLDMFANIYIHAWAKSCNFHMKYKL